MRKNLKVRKGRFGEPNKEMLKLVINSMLQRHQAQEHITSAESKGDMKYGEATVSSSSEGDNRVLQKLDGSKVGMKE